MLSRKCRLSCEQVHSANINGNGVTVGARGSHPNTGWIRHHSLEKILYRITLWPGLQGLGEIDGIDKPAPRIFL